MTGKRVERKARKPRYEPMEIGYRTDLGKLYADSLRGVCGLADLRAHVASWRMLAGDAYDAVHSPAFSWDEYQEGAAKERKGVFAGEAWAKKYSAILMPEILMHISIVAMNYFVPEGCAFIRLRDEGYISIADGIAHWTPPAREVGGKTVEQGTAKKGK